MLFVMIMGLFVFLIFFVKLGDGSKKMLVNIKKERIMVSFFFSNVVLLLDRKKLVFMFRYINKLFRLY